jgi:NAD(P)-dependent dehydrogenase (short-subunit alcohol dehydrogenase family)
VRTAQEAYGNIDIAVNCAFTTMPGLIDVLDEEDLQKSLDVNFIGHVHFVRYCAQAMNDGGSIILFSSAAAAQPMYGNFAYGCAKAATDSLVRYAALEYGPRGIRVNSILPGPIRTNTTSAFLDSPNIVAAFAPELPLGRMGAPADYAQAVVWLSKPNFITGAQLPISGGMQLNRVPRI